MRLALLGIDQTTVELARAAHDNGRDELVLFCDFDDLNEAQSALRAVAIRPQPWELLLTASGGGLSPCDAVLVSRDPVDDERRLEQLRKLVQAGVPMLITHPIHRSMLAYYELDMIRRETGCVMIPFLASRLHPLTEKLRELLIQSDNSPLGGVEQIVLERGLSERTKESVVVAFARDVDLLRLLGGEVAQLGAMGSPGTTAVGESAAYNNLNVQMAASENRLLRWWVVPANDIAGARLTVTGQRGRAVLTMPPEYSEWRLEMRFGDEPSIIESPRWNPYLAALDKLRAGVADRETRSLWPEAARAIEIAETVERSLAKGRTVDLYEQEYSSAATFKGLMSGLGCALLLFALGGMVVGALAANLLKHAGFIRAAQVAGATPYVFLALFGIFLALQLLLRLTRPADDTQK